MAVTLQKDYKIILVRNEEPIGNSTTNMRINEHKEEIQALFADGYKLHSGPFFFPGDNKSVWQVFIK